jgi:hypothetical protein
MITAFVAVIGLMGFFETAKFKYQIQLLLGGEPQAQAWHWCPQDLREIHHVPTRKVIREARELKDLCAVKIKPSSTEEIAQAEFEPLLKAIGSGAPMTVEASRSGELFRINGLAFRSPTFRQLLDSLN